MIKIKYLTTYNKKEVIVKGLTHTSVAGKRGLMIWGIKNKVYSIFLPYSDIIEFSVKDVENRDD